MGAMCSQTSDNPVAVSRTQGQRDPFSALPANKFTLNESKFIENPYHIEDERYKEWLELDKREN